MDTKFQNQKWFNQLLNGKLDPGNPVNMTYAFMPDDVFTLVEANNYLGSGVPFYYFDITKLPAHLHVVFRFTHITLGRYIC